VTRQSQRELERALEELQADQSIDDDHPREIIITDRVVETPNPVEYEGDSVQRTRLWRDDAGEWHTEELEVDEEDL
jgi:hypothetical protein